jgi:hypothetical protein
MVQSKANPKRLNRTDAVDVLRNAPTNSARVDPVWSKNWNGRKNL